MNQYVSSNGSPRRFFFSINSNFLPSQFVSLGHSSFLTPVLHVIFDLTCPLFKSPKPQLSIFLIGWLISYLCTYPNHLKCFSFIFSSILQLLNPCIFVSNSVSQGMPIHLSKHSRFRYSRLPTMILLKA